MNLIERMRGVRTVGDNHPIYENAEISIKEFSPCEVKPTSKYVLRKNLRRLNPIEPQIENTTVTKSQSDKQERHSLPVQIR